MQLSAGGVIKEIEHKKILAYYNYADRGIMIYLRISELEYYDDAVILIKFFYPGTDIVLVKEDTIIENGIQIIGVEIPIRDARSKKELHDEFKDKLYKQLVQLTGKTLPWGNMTGVRPSKIAVTMLESGSTEQEVKHFFMDEHYVSANKTELAITVAKRELELLDNIDYVRGYSLYVGIPFCPTTCLYCSFTSYSMAIWQKSVDIYLDALIKEIEFVARSMKNKRLDTIYFGGGTPTTLSPGQLDRLLSALENNFNVKDAYELTVEAGRPDSITIEKLNMLKAHKVGRISINPQTMNQETLDIIGRRHTVEQVVESFNMARDMGFDNINMDLIVGLPGEDKAMIEHTLRRVSDLRPDSLTVHSLAIKRAAAINIWKEKYKDLLIHNTDEIVAMTANYASAMGLEPYYMYRQKNIAGNFENVGYSTSGKECIYNILIMEEKQTIIAVGAGASSKIVFNNTTDVENGIRIERIENVKDVRNYIDRIDEMIDRKKKFFDENEF